MKIDFSKPIGIDDENTRKFREESEEIIKRFIEQVHTNPIVHKWFKQQQEKFKLEMIKNLNYYR